VSRVSASCLDLAEDSGATRDMAYQRRAVSGGARINWPVRLRGTGRREEERERVSGDRWKFTAATTADVSRSRTSIFSRC